MIEIRSYRRVFDLERRIYSVDHLRLNPGGVPVRGIVYFLVILAAGLLVAALPLLGTVTQLLPWYLRDIAVPAAGATLMSTIRIEGRTFHHAARALARERLGARRLTGLRRGERLGRRWHPQEIVALPDGSDRHLRRLRYSGPGAVLVCVEHERRGAAIEQGPRGTARRGHRAKLSVAEVAGARVLERAQVIVLEPGVRLLVRASRREVR